MPNFCFVIEAGFGPLDMVDADAIDTSAALLIARNTACAMARDWPAGADHCAITVVDPGGIEVGRVFIEMQRRF